MSFLATDGMSIVSSVGTIAGMLVVFVIILAAAYYTAKFLGSKNGFTGSARNIKVIETCRLAPDRYLQIIKAAGKYYLIGVTKNSITNIAELLPDEIEEYQPAGNGQSQFLDIFVEQFKDKFSKKK